MRGERGDGEGAMGLAEGRRGRQRPLLSNGIHNERGERQERGAMGQERGGDGARARGARRQERGVKKESEGVRRDGGRG